MTDEHAHEWLTVKEAAAREKTHPNTIYLAVRQGRLRAARMGGRGGIRIADAWLDAWLVSLSTPTIIDPDDRGAAAGELGALAFPRKSGH